MATPRKHWFRVADSVAHEPWSNDVCATFTRLLGHLNTRWARDGKSAADACSVTLSRATAMQLTGSGSLARARSILNALATHVTIVVNEQGTNTMVRWPKFAEFQRLKSESGDEVETVAIAVTPPPQSAPAPAPARRKRERRTAVSAEAAAPPTAIDPPAAPEPIPEPAVSEDPLGKHRMLLNLIAREPGNPREKELWLTHELPLIEAEVEAKSGTWKTLTLRWYRAYQRRPKIPGRGERMERTFEHAERRERELIASAAMRVKYPHLLEEPPEIDFSKLPPFPVGDILGDGDGAF